jgi:ABC-type antimicrobial peptide transport system permease subunit
MLLLAAFGGIAIVLATIGVYGVIAYTVTMRLHEFGVRLALGAQRRDVLHLVLFNGMRPVGAGIIVGAFGAAGVTRFVSAMLYEVQPIDPPTFVAVGAILILVAGAASYLPARVAARADPSASLREQ